MEVDNHRRPHRQDTFDLHDQIYPDDHQHLHAHADATMNYGTDDEEHSVLEDDSEAEEGDEYIEDDISSTLSIPNESIDFDMVYAFHSFAATVEGQANVVKGDSLYLMDDTNSYWWLVRVLKTQEVGYIPAENIETPFERLARLNKHRNIDLALPTQEEQTSLNAPRENVTSRSGHHTPSRASPHPPNRAGSQEIQARNVHFASIRYHYRFVPPLREGEVEDEDDEWNVERFEEEDVELAAEQMYMQSMEEDDGMQWDEDFSLTPIPSSAIPDALQPGSLRELREQQSLRAQQQQHVQQLQKELAAQQQQQQMQQQAEQAIQQAIQAQQQALQTSSSREISEEPRRVDPADVTETRKVTVTPTIAREEQTVTGQQSYKSSIVTERQQEDERTKRLLDDESSDDSLKKKVKGLDKVAASVSSTIYNKPSAKLRKEPSKDSKDTKDTTDDEGKDKKKKGSMFGGLFGRKKEKGTKETKSAGSASITSVESDTTTHTTPDSEDSGKTTPRIVFSDGTTSPTTVVAQQQQQQAVGARSIVPEDRTAIAVNQFAPSTPERTIPPQVSQHANQLRQRDQQQQALYQQYLNRSPSSPPEAQPSYGLQSVSAVMLSSPSTSSALGPPVSRPRPGSLILTSPQSSEAQNLSVIRVFAGRSVQTEATFKTVLLNPSTTASDLVRQAIQRFRLPSAELESDYYLTIKQVEGGTFAVLEPQEHPLVVFDNLVVEATELPKVKRSSVGSISSVSSNLSMLPAIKKLSMNDFTDDSAVKFYLNRRTEGHPDDSMNGHEGDETLIAASVTDDSLESQGSRTPHHATNSTQGLNATPERVFTSPSTRFPMQLVIYAEDLPEDMQFHPTTEAIVYKNALTDPSAPVVISPNVRRKVFMYPKNITVAEVTELGLERFGIQDGVIDGGDEVEDKTTKRRSSSRVRYVLMVSIEGQERELSPSSKIVDAFPRPPQYRTPDQNSSIKRRSFDAGQLLGSIDDVRLDDPVFVLRRATAYRISTSRRRSSVPLDEFALHQLHMHRESSSSYNSDLHTPIDESKLKQSRQEIIAAQRAATRATQRAIVSAQTNSVRGMDVLLPGNAMLRSSRYDVEDRMRYSYVEPDGETYDISDVVEQEWRDVNTTNKHDLLEGVFIRNRDGISDKLDRFLLKIRKGKAKEKGSSPVSSADSHQLSFGSVSPSEYSTNEAGLRSRSITPGSATVNSRMPSGNVHVEGPRTPTAYPRPLPATKGLSSDDRNTRSGTATPTSNNTGSAQASSRRRNPSIVSDNSGRSTPVHGQSTNLHRVEEKVKDITPTATPRSQQQRWPVIPKDDFGHAHMIAIIEYKGLKPKQPPIPPLDPVDELLFGAPMDLDSLHPQVRDIYASGFKQLEEMDKVLDTYIQRSAVGTF